VKKSGVVLAVAALTYWAVFYYLVRPCPQRKADALHSAFVPTDGGSLIESTVGPLVTLVAGS
jgi:hypothetical protein